MRNGAVEIVDLSERFEDSYLACLEEWSPEMDDAGPHKARWYGEMRDRGLRVKLAIDNDQPIGMIQYLPIENSLALGDGLYMILCIWVHGYPQGVGNRQGRGIGKALLIAAEHDTRNLGAKGLVAWGMAIPFWMKANWFKKHGYRTVDRQGMRSLLWKPFAEDAQAPRWIEKGPKPVPIESKVAVTAFINGWCPACNIVYERAKRAAATFGDDVVFITRNTTDQESMISCGESDCVYVDGVPLQRGPPPSYDRIHKKMARRVRKLTR